MRPLYKKCFRIEPSNETAASETAATCLGYVESWIDRTYEQGGDPSPGLQRVSRIDRDSCHPQLRSETLACGAFHHYLFWRRQGPGDEHRRWIVLVNLVSNGSLVDFQLQLGFESADLNLEMPSDRPSLPRIITTILSDPRWTCRSGYQPLGVLPIVITVSGVEDFCNDVLFSSERDLPAVVLNPSGMIQKPPVDARTLAGRVAGSARVFRVRDRVAAIVLEQFLGKDLAIGPDAIRVFAPGLQPGATGEGHWHLLGETIRAKGLSDLDFGDFLFGRLADRELSRFKESALLDEFESLAAEERVAHLDELRTAQASDKLFYEDYTGNLEEQNRQLRAERDGLQVELERKEQEIERLSYDLEAAQRNLRDLSSRLPQLPLESTQDQASGELSFDTVSDAVQHALTAFPDLLILDSALDSSEKVPVTYRFVGRVYEALRCLQLAANERNQNGRFKSGLKEYFKPLGFEYKRLSDTTKNSWGDEYTFLCEDVPVLFEEHFTIGVKSANTCISIHFSTRQRQDKIVVAYVGRHLRNTQS